MRVNDQFNKRELGVLLSELSKIAANGVIGDVVEMGCYKGLTSLEIQRVLFSLEPAKKLYLYDSFAGLPPKTLQDNSPAGIQFKAGELPASKQEVINLFRKAGLRVPEVKKAWFKDLTPQDIPDQIALAFLDGDFYESIMDSLKLVWPKLSPGAVVVVDDYQNEALPGAAKAVEQWLKANPARLKIESSLAILYKQAI